MFSSKNKKQKAAAMALPPARFRRDGFQRAADRYATNTGDVASPPKHLPSLPPGNILYKDVNNTSGYPSNLPSSNLDYPPSLAPNNMPFEGDIALNVADYGVDHLFSTTLVSTNPEVDEASRSSPPQPRSYPSQTSEVTSITQRSMGRDDTVAANPRQSAMAAWKKMLQSTKESSSRRPEPDGLHRDEKAFGPLSDWPQQADGGGRVSDSMRESSDVSGVSEDSLPPAADKHGTSADARHILQTTKTLTGAIPVAEVKSPVTLEEIECAGKDGSSFHVSMERLWVYMDRCPWEATLQPRKWLFLIHRAHFEAIVGLQNNFASMALEFTDSLSAAADKHRPPRLESTPERHTEPPKEMGIELEDEERGFIEAILQLKGSMGVNMGVQRMKYAEHMLDDVKSVHCKEVDKVRSEWVTWLSKLEAIKRPANNEKELEKRQHFITRLEDTVAKLQSELKAEENDHRRTKLHLQEVLETTPDQRLSDERARHTDTRERLGVLQQKIKELHATVEEKDEDLEDLKGEKALKDQDLRKAQTRIRVLEDENNKLREDHARKVARLTGDSARTLERKTAELQDKVDKVQNQVTWNKQEHERKEKEFDEILRLKDEKLVLLQKAIEEHLAETKALKGVLSVVKGAVKDL